jgi:uncharacterized membrane protein YdjX (TVP38/TMEM64 family)
MFETVLDLIRAWSELGAAGFALLSATIMLGALAFVPRAALCLIGGLVFGLAAIPIALLASTGGAVAAFLLSRHLMRARVRPALDGRPRLAAAAAAVAAEGWRLVGLLRLSPFPGTAMSYLLGVTGIRLSEYAAGTLLGLIPSVLVFVYLGAIGRTFMAAPAVSRAHLALLAAGLVAIAIAGILIARRARIILATRWPGSTGAARRRVPTFRDHTQQG